PRQDYILMPLWNDGSLFDSFSKDSDGDNKDNDGLIKESEIDNQERPNVENSTKDVNTVGPSINTASSNINTASPTVNTVRQSDDFFGVDNDMRSMDGVEVDLSNISTIYSVSTSLNTIIHKDHSLDNNNLKDPDYPDRVYKVEKALYGLHQAPRAWYETLAKYLLDNGFHRGKIDQTLFIKRQKEDIMLVQVYVDDIIFSQDKYVDEILRKFKYADVKPASTPMDKEKALLKDSDGDDVDVHLYMSMIGSLILISWQCKKQNVIATSTTKAEYVAAASCCGQVLWIQNQLLDYGMDGVEVDLSNISTTYSVSTSLNTIIHKDHSLDNVIGDMQSGVQTRRMTHINLFFNSCYKNNLKDPDYPDRVYKVKKALYGLHQAPRAWYKTLAKYLLDNRFHRGKIDQTLFIKRQKEDIMLVQVYVDDIIFRSTKKELCTEFEVLMHDKF
nr:hypothetical protein [Tanacetum cinerariifolium]